MKGIVWFFLCSVQMLALSYKMDVRLDIDKKTVSGKATIVWRNEQGVAAGFIPFHLYMNSFSDSNSIFMRESGGHHRGFGMDKDDVRDFGYCRIRSLRLDGKDSMNSFRYLGEVKDPERYQLYWPSEVSAFIRPDNTIGVLQLAAPLLPGQEATIEIEFETKFPKIVARAGYYKNFFMAGQWYPKIAVFEGGKGWNCHFYHANSEFFSDFADFDVQIDVPEGLLVGATGQQVAERRENGRRVVRFSARTVGDFAFTAWDKFRLARDKWKGVDLILLYQPGNDGTVRRQFRALKAGLDACSYLTGYDYPYPCFTLVDPPFRAMGAAGMEYPMLVTGGVLSPFIPENIPEVDMVIVHEFIHNFFYGMVASNEFEHAWMDEGLTSYVTAFAQEKYLDCLAADSPIRIGAYDLDQISNSIYRGAEYPAKAAWEFYGGYGISSYNKPAVFLKTLENLIGEPKMVRLFSLYFNRFKFEHPRPEDFYQVVREVAGDEMHDFIFRAFTSKAKLDYAVFHADSADTKSGYRVFFDPEKWALQKIAAPGPKAKQRYENTVVVGNLGDFAMPVQIEALMADGGREAFSWDGRGEWKRFEWNSEAKLDTVRIDPRVIYACDVSLQNNVRTLAPKTRGLFSRMAATLSMAAQFLFGYLAFNL